MLIMSTLDEHARMLKLYVMCCYSMYCRYVGHGSLQRETYH